MRLVHSFSTKRCFGERLKVNVYCFTLSCLYAKRSGFNIVLHTDRKGAELLRYAPYDEVIVDLENLSVPNNRIFAWCKFEAMKNEPEGSIHIDGDVFLKSPKIKDLLNFNDCDVIVQQIEIDGVYPWGGWDNSTIAFAKCEYPPFLPRYCERMYNCGVVGFKNKSVWEEYYKWYRYLIDQYNVRGVDIDSVPELVAEQQLLHALTKHKSLKVKELLDFRNLQGSANDLGYQHLLGRSKYSSLDKIKFALKRINANVFNKLEEIKWDI